MKKRRPSHFVYVMYSSLELKPRFYTSDKLSAIRYCKDNNMSGQLIYEGFTSEMFLFVRSTLPELLKVEKNKYKLKWE